MDDDGAPAAPAPLSFEEYLALATRYSLVELDDSFVGSNSKKAKRRFKGEKGIFESRSEEHTSELQSLMRISYAVFCLKKKTNSVTSSYITLLLPFHYIIILFIHLYLNIHIIYQPDITAP